jgi:predicted 3-demethylubiquinone-9 3-methyltransferase (glyoxalase superfamily)
MEKQKVSTKQKISPCLWFDGRAEEAAKFYTSIFPDSQIDRIARTSIDTPGAKEGAMELAEYGVFSSPLSIARSYCSCCG